ncbi:MAG: GIY-YIG nuclease family protein [Candidatus Margulisiibacteriota bacterium]
MYVYILQDQNGKTYTGITNDLDRRLKEHNSGQHKTTKHGANWEVVFKYECKDRKEARQIEKHLKSGTFREKRDIMLKVSRGRAAW